MSCHNGLNSDDPDCRYYRDCRWCLSGVFWPSPSTTKSGRLATNRPSRHRHRHRCRRLYLLVPSPAPIGHDHHPRCWKLSAFGPPATIVVAAGDFIVTFIASPSANHDRWPTISHRRWLGPARAFDCRQRANSHLDSGHCSRR